MFWFYSLGLHREHHTKIRSAEVTNGVNVGLDQATTLINIQSKLKSYLSATQPAT